MSKERTIGSHFAAPIFPLLLYIDDLKTVAAASLVCLCSFWILKGTAQVLKKIFSEPAATFLDILLLAGIAQLAYDFMELPPYWVLSVIVMPKRFSNASQRLQSSLSLSLLAVVLILLLTPLLRIMNPWIFLTAALALTFFPEQATLQKKDFQNLGIRSYQLFLLSAVLCALLWTCELGLPALRFYRIFALLPLAYFWVRLQNLPVYLFPAAFILSFAAVEFQGVSRLSNVLALLGYFSLGVFLLQLALRGLGQGLESNLISHSRRVFSFYLFFAILLAAFQIFETLFEPLQMFNWNLPFRALIS